MNFYKVSNEHCEFWATEGYKPDYGEVWYNMRLGKSREVGGRLFWKKRIPT